MTSITRSEDHRYTFRGKTYPGVTGILKIIDKSDALMAWAARNTAEAALANLGALPNLVDTLGPEGVIKGLTSRAAWKRDEAASLGTQVHALADQVARGELLPDEIPPTTKAYVMGYEDWWHSSGWTLRASEALLVNETLGYGGTLDILARDRDGRTVLADIKTGRAVYNETVLQLAAYGAAEVLEVAGVLYKSVPVDRYAILHVTRDGVREIEVPVGPSEMEAFRACIVLSGWRDSVKGRKL